MNKSYQSIKSYKSFSSCNSGYKKMDDNEKNELKKILLLYAFEQEMKNKINNLKYSENDFNNYFLISKDWIIKYKEHYHYDEIKKMILKKEELKNLLHNGYANAKNHINTILKKIFFSRDSNRNFPQKLKCLKDNNEFLSERNEITFRNNTTVQYWRGFELVNDDLGKLFSKSDFHNYKFNTISSAYCMITGGKVIIDLSNDDSNNGIYSCEIGSINTKNMLVNDEYIFLYDNEDAKNDNINYFKDDFINFQKENIHLGIDLECDLLSQEGDTYGIVFKIPPHD
jgi:hypothetical protein